MKRATNLTALLLLALGHLFAAQKPYQQATITDIQQKVNTRVLYYVVNTPITKDEPYFEVSVQLKDKLDLGRYIPRHADDTLPEEWRIGFVVDARIDGRRLFLKRPSGSDLQLVILKQTAIKEDPASSGTPAPK
jgi:hypothetical protein